MAQVEDELHNDSTTFARNNANNAEHSKCLEVRTTAIHDPVKPLGEANDIRNKESQEDSEDVITKLASELQNVSIFSIAGENTLNVPPAIEKVAALFSSLRYRNILVLTGAGVSCNAGIPDFRTPGTGLYDNLSKFNLPYPEAVFDLNFYKSNPQPFLQLARELWPGIKHYPTRTHSFIALLEKKGMLLRNYTQNIDMLEILAGVSEEKTIECHGHFRTASCISCRRPFDGTECKRIILEDQRAPTCHHCGSRVKPDIVFFGEQLPMRFHKTLKKDLKKMDLLLVMGTSLQVAPVSLIPDMVRLDCPRVLFNRELCGSFLKRNGPQTRQKNYDSYKTDIFQGGDCDRSIMMLCKLLGWEAELDVCFQKSYNKNSS